MFVNLYDVTVEVDDKTRVFQLSRIDKLTKFHVKGVDKDGLRVEFFSKEPFSYTVKQLY